MRRTKYTKKEKEMLKAPNLGLGGHMPYPPDNCPAMKRQWKQMPEIEFIDCIECDKCRYKTTCKRKKEHDNEWKEYFNLYQKINNKYKSKDLVE